MSLWTRPTTPESLNAMSRGTAGEHLGMDFFEVGDDFIRARLPVDHRTCQPHGLLHGGVSVALAETLGSVAANACLPPGWRAVGLDINANHLRGVPVGQSVVGTTRPVHIGRTTQVWQIDIHDEQGRPVCASRITMAVLAPKAD